MQNKFEKAGSVTVDSGIIQIGDPCYDAVLPEYFNMKKGVLKLPHEKQAGNYKKFAAALVVQAGLGDGVYDILVKRCTKTGCIKELKIKFF